MGDGVMIREDFLLLPPCGSLGFPESWIAFAVLFSLMLWSSAMTVQGLAQNRSAHSAMVHSEVHPLQLETVNEPRHTRNGPTFLGKEFWRGGDRCARGSADVLRDRRDGWIGTPDCGTPARHNRVGEGERDVGKCIADQLRLSSVDEEVAADVISQDDVRDLQVQTLR